MEPVTRTDVKGHYCFNGLAAGPYTLSANDPDKGYPETILTFYSVAPNQPRVTIPVSGSTVHLNWRIPYRAAIIRLLLTDAGTGKPLSNLVFDITVRGSAALRRMTGATESALPMLIPPNEDVLLTVGSPGYQPAAGANNNGILLNLPAGTERALPIALHRAP